MNVDGADIAETLKNSSTSRADNGIDAKGRIRVAEETRKAEEPSAKRRETVDAVAVYGPGGFELVRNTITFAKIDAKRSRFIRDKV